MRLRSLRRGGIKIAMAGMYGIEKKKHRSKYRSPDKPTPEMATNDRNVQHARLESPLKPLKNLFMGRRKNSQLDIKGHGRVCLLHMFLCFIRWILNIGYWILTSEIRTKQIGNGFQSSSFAASQISPDNEIFEKRQIQNQKGTRQMLNLVT